MSSPARGTDPARAGRGAGRGDPGHRHRRPRLARRPAGPRQQAAFLYREPDELPLTSYGDIDLARYIPHPTQYRVLPTTPSSPSGAAPTGAPSARPRSCTGTGCGITAPAGSSRSWNCWRRTTARKEHLFPGQHLHDEPEMDGGAPGEPVRSGLRLQWACNTRVDCVDRELLALMKRSGCWMINYGIESANQQSLDILRKGFTVAQAVEGVKLTKQAGIAPLCNFILGIPGETGRWWKTPSGWRNGCCPTSRCSTCPSPIPRATSTASAKKRGGSARTPPGRLPGGGFRQPGVCESPARQGENAILLQEGVPDFYANPAYLLKRLFSIARWPTFNATSGASARCPGSCRTGARKPPDQRSIPWKVSASSSRRITKAPTSRGHPGDQGRPGRVETGVRDHRGQRRSTDDTAEAAARGGAKVLSHPANGGYGKSILTGMAAATCDCICTTDATAPTRRRRS